MSIRTFFFHDHLTEEGLAQGWEEVAETLELDIAREMRDITKYDNETKKDILALADLLEHDLEELLVAFKKSSHLDRDAELKVRQNIRQIKQNAESWDEQGHAQYAQNVRLLCAEIVKHWNTLVAGQNLPSDSELSKLFDRGTACIRKMAFIMDKSQEINEELLAELKKLGKAFTA